jgi:hypothetical protein
MCEHRIQIALEPLLIPLRYHGNTTAFENPTDNSFWDEAYKAKYEGIGKPFTRSDWEFVALPSASFLSDATQSTPRSLHGSHRYPLHPLRA